MALMRPLTRVKSDLNSIFDEMDDMFKPFLKSSHPEIQEYLNAWHPAVDVSEDDTNVYLKAAIPGYQPKDIDLEVDRRIVSITGEAQQAESYGDNTRHLHREIVCGRFSRKIQLPYEVVAEQANAKFSEGLLMVTLPKAVQSRKLKIEVT